MRWAHLPSGGGIYDQHPLLLDHWYKIMEIEAAHERRKEAKRQQQQQKYRPPSRGSMRRR